MHPTGSVCSLTLLIGAAEHDTRRALAVGKAGRAMEMAGKPRLAAAKETGLRRAGSAVSRLR